MTRSGYLSLPELVEIVGDEVEALPWLQGFLPETQEEAKVLFSDHWHHIKMEFADLCQRFDDGDRISLLEAVEAAAKYRIPLPDWAAEAFSESLWKYESAHPEARTLSDAFGVHRPRHFHLEPQRERMLYPWFITKRYKALKEVGLITADNADGGGVVWEQIAKELEDPSLLTSTDNPSPDPELALIFVSEGRTHFSEVPLLEPKKLGADKVKRIFYGE